MVTVKVLEDTAIPWTPEEDTNYGGVQILDDKGEVVKAGGTVDLDTGLAQILYSQGYVEDVDGVLVAIEVLEPEEPEPEPPDEEEEGEEEEVAPYDGWTKAELADELEKRGLPKSGTRDELVERLVEDDAE